MEMHKYCCLERYLWWGCDVRR